jgi:protein O-mannosyl-transferase
VSKRKPAKGSKKSRQKKKSSGGGSANRSLWITLGIIAGVTLLAMLPLLSAGFVDIDDKKLILDKASLFLNHPWRIFSMSYGTPHYKPVTYFTWMLEYRLAGPNPFIFHFNNILLHIGNSIIVFFLIREIAAKFEKLKGHEFQIALFTALLFGVHPMHVESVGWVVERKDVLYTCLYLLGLTGYVKYLNSGNTCP